MNAGRDFEVTVRPVGLSEGVSAQEDDIAFIRWTELVGVRERAERVPLVIHVNHEPIAFAVHGGKTVSLTENGCYTLEVPVHWNQNGAPHTRVPGADNVDIILVKKGGFLTDLQVGVITRGGRFFATVQEVWAGYLANDRSFVALAPEFNYPGASFEKSWPAMAEAIRSRVQDEELGRWETAEAVRLAYPTGSPDSVWHNALPAPVEGWERGNVLFFNAVTGTGYVLGEDGRNYFVHFSKIVRRANQVVPMLHSMEPVYFRHDPAAERPSVKSVKSAT